MGSSVSSTRYNFTTMVGNDQVIGCDTVTDTQTDTSFYQKGSDLLLVNR